VRLDTVPLGIRVLLWIASLVAIGSAGLAAPVPLSSLVASPVEGSWKTQNGTEITIAPCPEGYCGTLSWIVVPPEYSGLCEKDKAAFGAQMLDLRNPDKTLRSRPLLGMQIMSLKPTGDPLAFTAHIYNSEDGKSYDGNAWIVDHNDTLRLGGGCVGSLCVVTQDWPRVPTREGPPDFTCGQ
jgi:uncharacterized protein (DUF2147 family)